MPRHNPSILATFQLRGENDQLLLSQMFMVPCEIGSTTVNINGKAMRDGVATQAYVKVDGGKVPMPGLTMGGRIKKRQTIQAQIKIEVQSLDILGRPKFAGLP